MGALTFGVTCSIGAFIFQWFFGFDSLVLACLCASFFVSGAALGPLMVRNMRSGEFNFGLIATFTAGALAFTFVSVLQFFWVDHTWHWTDLARLREAVAFGFLQAMGLGFVVMVFAFPFGAFAGEVLRRWVEAPMEKERMKLLYGDEE